MMVFPSGFHGDFILGIYSNGDFMGCENGICL